MNTPLGTAPAQPADPTTPGARPAPTALGGALTSVLAGTPLATVTVWLLETYGTAHGQPLKFDSVTATAIGAAGAGVIGYLTQVAQGWLSMLQDWATRPPPPK